MSLFCSQVFKTTSNANFDVNIALIAFCSLAVTKYVSSLVVSSLLSCGLLADSLLQLSFVLAPGGGYFLIRDYWGCAAGWGRIPAGLTIMGLHF